MPAIPVCVSMLAGRSYIGDSLFAFFSPLWSIYFNIFTFVSYLSDTYFRFHFKLFRTSFARSE